MDRCLGQRETGLSLDEVTLPEVLGPHYDTALIGKWHLGHTDATGGLANPNRHGWDHHHGSLSGQLESYLEWPEFEDGERRGMRNDYALSWKVDRAVAWIEARDPDRPWMLWLALNAPHEPFHAPPTQLHHRDLTPDVGEACPEAEARNCYAAMIEAIDSELGRLFGAVSAADAPTAIIVVGDNGAARAVIEPPFSRPHAKGTVYEGGVRVPLIIGGAGAGIADPGRMVDALAQTVDLFATLIELTGLTDLADISSDAGLDSHSLVPYLRNAAPVEPREWLYAERFDSDDPNSADRALRDADYAVIVPADGDAACYDVRADIDNETDLRAGGRAPAACDVLEAQLTALGSREFAGE